LGGLRTTSTLNPIVSSAHRLPPPERNRVHKMMNLRVLAHRDGTLIADWGCNVWPLPVWSFKVTTPAFKLRAVLTNDKGIEVEPKRV
jgi:hypothetical protein